MSLVSEADFGLSLLRETSSNATTVLSPLSIALVLSLVQSGAKGNTKEQIKNALCKGSTDEESAQYFSQTQKSLVNRDHPYYKNWMYCNKPGNISCVDEQDRERYIKENLTVPADAPLDTTGVLVNIANRVFVRNEFTVKKSYQDEISRSFESAVQSLDFKNSSFATKIVNDFVKNETMGKINNLVTEDSFTSDKEALLVNAVYFFGRWYSKFSEFANKQDKFYAKEGEEACNVTYMQKEGSFQYLDDEEFTTVSLPYRAKNVFFTVVLPNKRFGLSSVLNLTGAKLQEIISSKNITQVHIAIPKFKLEIDTPLPEILKKVGITEAFSRNADLSGISEKRLSLGDAKHKVFIEVNEDGTTAAAATVIEVVPLSAPPTPKFTFVADHPFLFVISHGGHILFTGQYYG